VKGPNLPSMAWRNLWRNRRRTLLTLSSIAFGTMLAVLFTGIGDSNWRQMIALAARLGGGHVTLQHPEYLDTPTLSRTVRGVDRLVEVALRDSDVERAVARITGQMMLATATQSYGAGFIAYDPEAEDESTLSILEALAGGEHFSSPRDPGIVLGQRLSDNLKAGLGRKVVYTLTDKKGEIVQGVARVSGIIRTGSPSVDSGLCLLPIDSFREVLGYAPEEATQVGLFLRDQRRAPDVAARLGDGATPGVSALTWKQTQPDLAGFIAMKVAGARFMEVIIMILVAAGIFNTLFVSVMERLREFGIMTAIGFSPASLFGLVMFESFWLGVTGLLGAVLVTAGPYYYMATRGIDISAMIGEGGSNEIAGVALTTMMHAEIYPENVIVIGLAALLATLLSGVYPAWHAGRVVPVETIRLV
jgi:ABC-type lipoprotein release transport system permease subunit